MFHRIEALVREMIDEAVEPAHDEMDAGRFQRLEETRSQAERNAVAVPELLAPAGREAQESRIRERLLPENAEEIVQGRVIR